MDSSEITALDDAQQQPRLRLAEKADEPLLYALYASSRSDEMALVEWDEAQKESFLKMQFKAQLSHYQTAFPKAEHHIVLLDNRPMGRIYVETNEAELRLLDITLLPEYRNRKVGTILMQNLMGQARLAGKPVRFYVWESNLGALRWYHRMGFSVTGSQGIYKLMAWQP